MAKHPGIRALRNLKGMKKPNSKAVETRRVAVMRDKDITEKTTPVFSAAAYDPEIVEESPAAPAFGTVAGSSVLTRPMAPARGSRRKRNGFITQLKNTLLSLTGKRSADAAALDFAMNNRHRSKRERRRKTILISAASAALVIAAALLMAFAPSGETVSGQPSPQPSDSLSSVVAGLDPSKGVLPSPTPQTTIDIPLNPGQPLDRLELLGEGLGAEPSDDPIDEPLEEPSEEPSSMATTQPEETPPPITMDEVLKYFVVEADTYYNEVGYSTNHYDYSKEELYMLAQVIDGEARGESFKGKVAVGNVVMNRVLNRHRFGNSITAVVTAPRQFTGYSPNRTPSSSSKRAARAVLEKQQWVIPQNVYYFRSGAPEGSNWGSHKFYTKIGGHCFYTENYSGRSRSDKVPPALFDRTYKYAQYGCKPEGRVKRIQYMLNKLGFDVKADKYYGLDTVEAIKLFQESKGLEADGVAGPATVKALINEYGLLNYYKTFMM